VATVARAEAEDATDDDRAAVDELPAPCLAGECMRPQTEGGLGVVLLAPLNLLAVQLYHICQRLGPELAWRLVDVSWHPDRGLLAQQLCLLVEAWGAAWVGTGMVPGEAGRAVADG
jgi:hypothetical protein